MKDGPGYRPPPLSMIQNSAAPTSIRAVITGRTGPDALCFTGDRSLENNRQLANLISTGGDGHASVCSQLALSAAERGAPRRCIGFIFLLSIEEVAAAPRGPGDYFSLASRLRRALIARCSLNRA